MKFNVLVDFSAITHAKSEIYYKWQPVGNPGLEISIDIGDLKIEIELPRKLSNRLKRLLKDFGREISDSELPEDVRGELSTLIKDHLKEHIQLFIEGKARSIEYVENLTFIVLG